MNQQKPRVDEQTVSEASRVVAYKDIAKDVTKVIEEKEKLDMEKGKINERGQNHGQCK